MSKVLDISAWQGTMNFATAKKAGIEGVMCRAAYSTAVDKKFYEFAADAEKAGVPIGAYVFSTWHYNNRNGANNNKARELALAEGKAFIDIIKKANVKGFVAIDIELESGQSCLLTKDAMTNIVNEYLAMIEKAGYKPCMYTGISYLYEKFNVDALKYPIWCAFWAGGSTPEFPTGRYGDNMRRIKNKIVLWQYTSDGDGKKYGAGSARVDMNYLYADFVAGVKPAPKPQPTPTPAPAPKPTPKPATNTYTVKAGDTLSGIAAKYGTTWQKLYDLNKKVIGSNPNVIKVGQVLTLPTKETVSKPTTTKPSTSKPATTTKTKTYTIKAGDTLTSIGKKYGVSWQKIYEANKKVIGSNPDLIKAGTKIKIP